MIERLELRSWRSFDHVEISFQPGTTFLVAPNGIGKTSLLLGLAWALFGEHSTVDARACVRLGHDHAEASVTLLLPDSARLVIRRTVTVAGKSTVEYSNGHQPIPASTANELLVGQFGAPIDIAARLAVIRGSGKDDGELQLREHLYDAFGVSGLRRSATVAGKLHKEAVAARKKLRTASRTQVANRDQLATTAANLERELEAMADRRVSLSAAVADAVQAQRTATQWQEYDAAVAARADAIAEFLVVAANGGIHGLDIDDVASEIRAAVATNRESSEAAQTRQNEARAHALAASTALDLLQAHDPECPTCSRPFHGDELQRALDAQRASHATAQSSIDETAAELVALADRRDHLEQLSNKAAELRRQVAEPGQPRPADDLNAIVESAQAALRQHDEHAGSITAEHDSIAARLDDDKALTAAYEAERVAWRREALTQASAAALTATAERLAEEYIEPLSRQVQWRWKVLFGEDGLQLRPDGTIVRVVGDRQLPWNQLSSGEQIWARLVASLLVLRSSTTLPFAWLDEPLEHLDPRARRIVATDLAMSTSSGLPSQLIVTTYEHTLARQLAEDLPNTHLRQINRTDTFELPPRRRDTYDTESSAEHATELRECS